MIHGENAMKVKEWTARVRDLEYATGHPASDRVMVNGYGHSQAAKVTWAVKQEEKRLAEEARYDKLVSVDWIESAKVSLTVWNGTFERYYAEAGATYVNLKENCIRTAFSKDEYDEKTSTIMEELKKHGY